VLRVISRMNVGGPARCVLNLTAGLPHRKFHTIVATGRSGAGEGDLSRGIEDRGAELADIPHLGRPLRPLRDLHALLALRSLILKFRPHILHTHASKAGFLGRLAALWSGIPLKIVHTYHGHVLDSYFSPLQSSVFRELERRLAGSTDVLIAVTPSVRRELLARHGVGCLQQYVVIPSGGHRSRIPSGSGSGPGLREELGLGRLPLAAVIGRLVPIKGHDLLLRSLPRLLAQIPELKILLVGDGPGRVAIERFIARRPEGRALLLLGQRDDVGRVLRAVDLLVLPSLKEGLPTVMLEAAAAGVPIAASRLPGVTDVLTHGDAALLFDPGSPDELAQAVVTLCRAPELGRRLAARALQCAADIPTAQQVVGAHERLYENLYRQLNAQNPKRGG